MTDKMVEVNNEAKIDLTIREIKQAMTSGFRKAYFTSLSATAQDSLYKIRELGFPMYAVGIEERQVIRLFVFADEETKTKFDVMKIIDDMISPVEENRKGDYHYKLGLILGYPPKACELFSKGGNTEENRHRILVNFNDMVFQSYSETLLDDIKFIEQNYGEIVGNDFVLDIARNIASKRYVRVTKQVQVYHNFEEVEALIKEYILN